MNQQTIDYLNNQVACKTRLILEHATRIKENTEDSQQMEKLKIAYEKDIREAMQIIEMLLQNLELCADESQC